MIASYWIQIALSISLWLALVLLPVSRHVFKPQASTVRRLRRQEAYIIETAIEFQIAQCYLTAIIQIANIVQLRSFNFHTQNLAQFMNTIRFSFILMRSGSLTTLVLVALWLHGYKSLYVSVLTILSPFLSTTSFVWKRMSNQLPESYASSAAYSWPDCGNINPVSFCSTDPASDSIVLEDSFGGYFWLMFGLYVIVSVVLSDTHIFSTMRSFHTKFAMKESQLQDSRLSRSEGRQRYLEIVQQVLGQYNDWVRRFCGGLVVVALLPINRVLAWGVWTFASDLYRESVPWTSDVVLDLGTWSFGQILAVAVWAPVLFKFCYLQIREPCLSVHYLVAEGGRKLPKGFANSAQAASRAIVRTCHPATRSVGVHQQSKPRMQRRSSPSYRGMQAPAHQRPLQSPSRVRPRFQRTILCWRRHSVLGNKV